MTDAFPNLRNGETELSVSASVLVMRHVHPKAIDGGKVESWAFAPNSSDQGCMSVTQSSVVDPEEAFEDYTVHQKRASAGLWALSTEEVSSSGSRTVDDQGITPTPPRGHAFIDYRDMKLRSRPESKRAKRLRDFALDRGCVFVPPEDAEPAEGLTA